MSKNVVYLKQEIIDEVRRIYGDITQFPLSGLIEDVTNADIFLGLTSTEEKMILKLLSGDKTVELKTKPSEYYILYREQQNNSVVYLGKNGVGGPKDYSDFTDEGVIFAENFQDLDKYKNIFYSIGLVKNNKLIRLDEF